MAQKKFCVGIDIGASRIKVCQLDEDKRGLFLQQYGQSILPAGAIVDGVISDPNPIIDTLRKLKATHKLRNTKAAISVSGHQVIIKKITVPKMSQGELETNIKWEAEQYIPFDIEEVELDFHVVSDSASQKGHMDVILVAVKKDYLEDYTSIITEVGFEPMVCDVDSFAIENMFLANYETPPGETVALVNVGATKTNINILTDGVSNFTRDLSVGGDTFTEEIQKQLSITAGEAEILKLGVGDASADVPQEVRDCVQGIADNITSELQRSIDFYSATSADAPPAHIYLTGGSARLEALEQSIKSRMWVHVTEINPFHKIITDQHEPDFISTHAPSAGVAVGLALRFPGDS